MSAKTPEDAGKLVIETTRRMLEAVEASEGQPDDSTTPEALGPIRVVTEILASSEWDEMTQSLAIALLSASIMWASNQTGKRPDEIMDELARRFLSPD